VAIRPSSLLRRLRLAFLAGIAVLAFAPHAHAGLLPSCGGSAERPFAKWGDYMAYNLVRDGTFEAGGAGWSLAGGARVVEGNETFYVHAPGETRSLLLPRGSSATSPPVCMTILRPTMRFFAVSPDGAGSLRVEVVSRNLLGVLSVIDGGTVRAGSSWAPTPTMSLLGSNLSSLIFTTWVNFRFRPVDAAVRIDDVYVDPWVIR
jgi:hypothetical protein